MFEITWLFLGWLPFLVGRKRNGNQASPYFSVSSATCSTFLFCFCCRCFCRFWAMAPASELLAYSPSFHSLMASRTLSSSLEQFRACFTHSTNSSTGMCIALSSSSGRVSVKRFTILGSSALHSGSQHRCPGG